MGQPKHRRTRRSDGSSTPASSQHATGSSSVADAASTVGIIEQGEVPAAARVRALGGSIGNANVSAMVADLAEPRSKDLAGPGLKNAATEPAAASASTASDGPVATVSADRVGAIRRDLTDSSASSADASTATVADPASAASSVAAAPVPAAQDAMKDVMDGWSTAASLLHSLKLAGAKIFDEAADAATGKKLKKVAKERARFGSATAELETTMSAGLRDAAAFEQDLAYRTVAPPAQVAAHREAVTSVLTALLRSLMDGAKLAYAHGDPVRAGTFTRMADQAKDAGGHLEKAPDVGAKEGTDHKGNLATATTVFDTGNNLGPGLVGGTIGGVEAASKPILTGVASGAASISAGAAGVFGGLGILFGSIGMALGIKASFRGASSAKELRELEPTLASDELNEATAYAERKKARKSSRGKGSAIAGGLAVTAGVAGIVAISVATLGIGAAILGVGAALLGLGFLIGKWIHKKRKRAKYGKMLAESLIDAATDDSDPAEQARAQTELTRRKITGDLDDKDERKAAVQRLSAMFQAEERSRRNDTAGTIYRALVGDDVSDQIDAERVVEALHLKVDELRSLREPDAVAKIAGKMASW